MTTPAWSIRRLTSVDEGQVTALAAVLSDCVAGGASVSFMAPLTIDRSARFWRRVARDVETGARGLIIAEDGQGIPLRANRQAFERIQLRVRRLVDVQRIDMGTDLLGTRMETPIVIAPTSSQRALISGF